MMDDLEAMGRPRFKSIDEVLAAINPYGRFQRMLTIVLCIVHIPSAFQLLITFFIETDSPWKCVADSTICLLNGTHFSDNTERCKIPRNEWVYTEAPDFSIITSFDLYCEREWLVHLTASSLFIGWLIGSFLISWAADNFGRKIVIFPSSIIIVVVGFTSAFVSNIYVFIACRFIIGFFTSGNFHILYILAGEFVDNKHRPLATISINITYSVAVCLLSLKAYFIKKWKHLMIVCTIPYLLITIFYKFVPKSIHWLHVHGYKENLTLVFKRIAYWNKTTIPDGFIIQENPPTKRGSSTPLDLFRTCTVATRSVVLIYGWFTTAMIYFGLSLSAGDLGGSVYRDFVIMNVIEIPSILLSIYCCGRLGRKKTISTCMILSSLACITISFIPYIGNIKNLRVFLGVFGKACVTISINGIISWAMELYATDIRANAMGVLNVAARFGGASAPWIAHALKDFSPKVPFITMGSLGLIAGCIMITLPETKGVILEDVSRVKELPVDSVRSNTDV